MAATTTEVSSNKSEVVSVKEHDFLDQDQDIRGQKYVCMSFLSPEDVIKQKEVHFFNKFLSHFSTDLSLLFSNVQERFKEDSVVVDMMTNLKDRYDYVFNVTGLQKEFEFYKETNIADLEKEYLEKNNFQTTVRGIKVRGTYESITEAKNRASAIKKFDKNFDVFVGEVGCWCPWSPYPEEIKDQEYSETQLNTMMKKYRENLDVKDEYYSMRMDEMVQKVKKHATDETTKSQVNGEKVLVECEELNAAFVTLPEDVNEAFTQKDPWMARKDGGQ